MRLALRRFTGETPMLIIRRVAGVIGVVAAVGFAALGVLLESSEAVLVCLFIGLFAAAAAWTLTYLNALEVAPERSPGADNGVASRRAILAAAFTTAALLAISGMIAVMGPAAAPVMALIALAIIGWAWLRHRERTRTRPGATIDEVDPLGPLAVDGVDNPLRRWEGSGTVNDGLVVGDDVGALSDEELCLRWRRSFVTIEHLDDPRLVDHIARRRRGLLDEIERRHPAQFAQWLAAGARAAGNPARFLTTDCGPATARQRHRRE